VTYTLPRNLFDILVDTFKSREKAELFAKAFEEFLTETKTRADDIVIKRQENLKAEIYNDLRNELATKEFVRAEINELRAEFNELRGEVKRIALLIKVLIGLAIFGLTLSNPAFVKIIEKLF
jgi:hypothetical protein